MIVRAASNARLQVVLVIALAMLLPALGWSQAEPALVTLQMKDVDVQEALKIVSDRGELNLVVHADVKGRITLYLDEIPVETALTVICEMADLGFITRPDGITYVMTAARYQDLYGTAFQSPMETRVFPIQDADLATMMQSVQQIKTQNGRVVGDRSSHAIVATDIEPVLDTMASLITSLDTPRELRVLTLRHVNVNDVLPRIQPFITAGATVQLDTQANRLILKDAPQKVEEVASLLSAFDSPRETETRVFPLAHASHELVLAAIQQELTQAGRVVADQNSRKLFVTDLPENLEAIASMVEAMDVRTPGVTIEARIMQVTLTEDLRMGVNWGAIFDDLEGLDVRGVFDQVLTETDPGITAMVGDLEQDEYTALVEALETLGSANLLSTPRITAQNGQEASILVGTEIPYKTIDTREEDGAIRTFENVKIVSVGIKLVVTPTIHRDGFVSMVVRPEVSSVTGFSESIPIVETTTTSTTVMARDGSTVLLGGLITDDEVVTKNGVPILQRIPLLGMLFRSTEVRTEKKELVIMLTPTVLGGE